MNLKAAAIIELGSPVIYYRQDKPYNNNYNKSEAGNPFFNSE